ncbi:superoxide dismutase family protein [Hyphococcus sp.]|jgi:Cu-Zn family superoxide dismutase|uniref:superoxide dismutase family protein n=1 Tax=Hyphococcus sp. TaxID=2038636 RepID=UPI003D0CF709
MKVAGKIAAISAISALILAGCGKSGADTATFSTAASAPSLAGWGDASADLLNAQGEKTGEVALQDAPEGILMRVSISGLSEGWHGMHLHQVGDCSDGADGFKASGGHINPEENEHGLLNPSGYEAADLPNIYAGASGVAAAELFNTKLSLSDGGPLLDADGFAVVVHENADDHMTQPIGGAGGRVACAAFSLGE